MDSLVESRWPPGLAVMKTIDDLLRCGICFDYFNIAMMIPQCSHNYCSLCIRKFLSYKTQCPTCCVTVTEPDLKNNRILDELVKSLNFARSQSASMSFLQIVSVEHHSLLWFIPIKKLLHPSQPSATTTVTSQQPALRQYPQQQKHHHSLNHLLQFALESPPISPASSSSKNLAAKVNTPVAFRHSLKQGSRLMENFLIREMSGSTSELLIKENEKKLILQKEVSTSSKTKETPSIEKTAPRSLDAHVPETPSTSTLKQVTRVDCPVCGVNIPENHINKHLDSCLTRDEKKESLRSSIHKRKPLPKTVYNLLSDRDLKKKLKEHGLSIQGNKQQLIKRHQEFVHMYNAQCDALHPKSAAEIVQEIENMEKTRMRLEASKLNESIMVFTKDQTEKEIDEIHSRYRKKHQNEFRLLVDQAKKGYKKTVEMSKKKVTKEEDGSTEKLLPVFVEREDKKMKFSDTSPITNHFSQSKLESPGRMEPDRPDDSSSCTDIQEEALSSSESDSFNSSSSDIIRDLLEEEEAWEASHKNDLDLQDAEMSPVQNRRTRSSENAEIEPSNKRNRN